MDRRRTAGPKARAVGGFTCSGRDTTQCLSYGHSSSRALWNHKMAEPNINLSLCPHVTPPCAHWWTKQCFHSNEFLSFSLPLSSGCLTYHLIGEKKWTILCRADKVISNNHLPFTVVEQNSHSCQHHHVKGVWSIGWGCFHLMILYNAASLSFTFSSASTILCVMKYKLQLAVQLWC